MSNPDFPAASARGVVTQLGRRVERVVRRVPIDWPGLFREAEIEPCPCKLAKPLMAGGEWCLMIDEPGDGINLRFIVVHPPSLEGEETKVKIERGEWVFLAPGYAEWPLLQKRDDARRDKDGHCTVCGCELDEYGETEADHICPPGFRTISHTGGGATA